jgi:hypothetical protein
MESYINTAINFFKAVIMAGTVLRVVATLIKCQTDGLPLNNGIQKSKKVIKAGILGAVLPSLLPIINIQFFAGVDNSMPAIAITVFINTVTNMLIMIEPAVIIFIIIKEVLVYKISDDGAKVEHKKNALVALGVGILVITATATLNIIFRYY